MRRPPLLFTLLLLALSAHGPGAAVAENHRALQADAGGESGGRHGAGPAVEDLLGPGADRATDRGIPGRRNVSRADDSRPSAAPGGATRRRRRRRSRKRRQLDAKSPLPALALARLETERGQPQGSRGAYEKAVALLAAGRSARGGDAAATRRRVARCRRSDQGGGGVGEDGGAESRTISSCAAGSPTPTRRISCPTARSSISTTSKPTRRRRARARPPADRPHAPGRGPAGRGHRRAGKGARADRAGQLAARRAANRSSSGCTSATTARRNSKRAGKSLADENPRDLGACLQLIDLYERLGDLEEQRAWLEAASSWRRKTPTTG